MHYIKSKLFKKWLLTYFVLIIISLTFIFGINTLYEKSIKEDIKKLNRSYLEQAVSLFDDDFMAIDRLVFTLGLDSRFINLLNMKENLSVNDRYEIRTIVKNIDVFTTSNRLIESISIFAKEPNFLMDSTGVYYGQYVGLFAEDNYDMPMSIYEELMEVCYKQQVFRLKDWYRSSEGDNPLIYIQSLPIQFPENPKGALMIKLDDRKLAAIGESALPSGKLLVLSDDKTLIYSNDGALYHKALPISELIEEAESEVIIDDTVYIKAAMTTQYRHWSYINLIPKELYYQPIRQLHRMIIGMVLCFFLLNIIIAYIFTNRMYSPVRRMISTLRQGENETDKSEYEYIENVISKNMIEQKKLKHDLYQKKKSLKRAFLSKLLRGHMKDSIEIDRQLQEFNIAFSAEGYQLMLIHWALEEGESSNSDVAFFIVQNIFEEILSGYFSCQVAEVDGQVACIIDYDESSLTVADIEEVLTATIDTIREAFYLRCVIGISCMKPLLLAMPEAYQEAMDAVNLALLSRERSVISYEESQKFIAQYEFSAEQEYRLIHYIKAGDSLQTKELIDTIIDKNIESGAIKYDYLQCLMFDLMGAILKSLTDKSVAEQLNKTEPIRRMTITKDIEEMRSVIHEVAVQACRISEHQAQQIRKVSIEEQVNNYIRTHYSDPDLNGTRLGEIFHMTPSYLSRLYKNETGNTILYALNTARIEAAKEMLETTGKSINEIAGDVGYLYSNAFIRFFKKHTGVTPGRYKEMNRSV